MSDKETQIKEEELEKVSGGHFEPEYGAVGYISPKYKSNLSEDIDKNGLVGASDE